MTYRAFTDYFRCPDQFGEFGITGQLPPEEGYFLFHGTVCYGRQSATGYSSVVTGRLPEVSGDVNVTGGQPRLPFDLSEVVTNLRQERYRQMTQTALSRVTNSVPSRGFYYFLRPILPVAVRKHLQRIGLRGWNSIPFPRWPVDFSVETLMQSAMRVALTHGGVERIPFIWFWPEGYPGGAMITHDVEGPSGQAFCDRLMDIDDAFGFKAAFQIVPRERYEASARFIDTFRRRGFEVNVHDLNHDGHLFRDEELFRERALQINRYARGFGSRGFRAGAMHRRQEWFNALDVSFDMSVPNVAHLEPQRGGCCTVMPYFIEDILELPLTTIQDYSLFQILGDYSIAIWRRQIDLILSNSGLISILTHPDYLIEKRARVVYSELLAHIRQLRDERKLWVALPGDVDRWWRSRRCMRLVQTGDAWRIEGEGSDRARIAFAMLDGDRVVYTWDGPS